MASARRKAARGRRNCPRKPVRQTGVQAPGAGVAEADAGAAAGFGTRAEGLSCFLDQLP